jgi:predicted nucleic acid-binding protein
MPFVLDASATIAWCLEDEFAAQAEAIRRRMESDFALVPALWIYEVVNALTLAERRKRLAAGDARELLDLLSALPIKFDDGEAWSVGTAVQRLAESTGLTAYDASYLELALRCGQPLATLDTRLRSAARAHDVETI